MSDTAKKLLEQQQALEIFFDALMTDVQTYADKDSAAIIKKDTPPPATSVASSRVTAPAAVKQVIVTSQPVAPPFRRTWQLACQPCDPR